MCASRDAIVDDPAPAGRQRLSLVWIIISGAEWGALTVMLLMLGVRIHELTHSAFWLGLQVATLTFPYTVFSLQAGRILDRFPTRAVLLVCYGAQAAVAALLAIASHKDYYDVPVILAASLVFGLLMTVEAPANWYVLRQLSSDDKLMRNNAWSTSMSNVCVMAFTAAIGFEVDRGEVTAVFVVYLLVAIPLLAVITALPARPPATVTDSAATSSDSADHGILAKLRRNRNNGNLVAALALIPLIAGFMTPILQMLPALASWATGQSTRVGPLMASVYLGCTLVVVVSWLAHRYHWSTGRKVLVCFAAAAVALVLIGGLGGGGQLDPRWWALLPGLFLIGLTSSTVNVALMSVVQQQAPSTERGFFLGVAGFLLEGILPLTAILLGGLIDLFGVGPALLIAAAALAVLVVYQFSRARFRSLDPPLDEAVQGS